MFKPNKLILKLIISDFFLHGGWGIIGPVFAIFITAQIDGGSAATVGFAVALFWMIKSTLQPFFAHRMDMVRGEEDDLSFLKVGMVIVTFVPLFYIFASTILHVFLLEIIRGVGMAMIIPSWYGMFTRHIDKNWEAYTWSLQSTSLGYAYAAAALLGGMMAVFVGFKVIFFFVFLFKAISLFLFFSISKESIIRGNVD